MVCKKGPGVVTNCEGRVTSERCKSWCDIGRAGAEVVVERSSEAVERTPSTPPSMP